VLIRSPFPGRHERITLFRFFPGAQRIAETFPTVEATVAAFATAGFAFEALQFARRMAAANYAYPDDKLALADLLERWNLGLGMSLTERRMAL
jgi:hypothetical protein